MKLLPFQMLSSLHWLPVNFRVDCKICLLTYMTICETKPIYLPSNLSTSLPCWSLRSNIKLCWSLGSGPTQAWGLFTLAPLLSGTTRHFSCNLQEVSQDTSLWLGLSSIETSMSDGSLMLWNHFINFAVEHQFGCCATQSGYNRDIGAIEIWLIDWLMTPWTDRWAVNSTEMLQTESEWSCTYEI